ncbi:MAG: hypothetical protein ABSG50_07120 [Opitutaceae bacterium]|jgi:hypothetical protein
MKSSDLFALAVRIVGLVSLLYMIGSAVMLFGSGLPFFLVVKEVIWLLVSIYLLRGAPHVVRFAYPERTE